MTNYPPVQYSVFVEGQRDKQFVLRGETIEKVKNLKKELDTKILDKMKKPEQTKLPAYTCEACKGKAELVEGISKKTNKPYKGIFCLDKVKCGKVKFL